MKLVVLLFLNIFLFTSCACINKSNSDTPVSSTITTNVTPQEQSILFNYTASTRGFYQKIVISDSEVLTTRKRGGHLNGTSYAKEDWIKLNKILKNINLEQLPKFKPPSKDFQFDGAPLARLRVTSNNKTYETQGFDHGNPPKEIVQLVKEILSISENIE